MKAMLLDWAGIQKVLHHSALCLLMVQILQAIAIMHLESQKLQLSAAAGDRRVLFARHRQVATLLPMLS